MNEMYFESILIADIYKHTARFQNFERGMNIITSTDNHVGKSSLIKSLYYALGAEVEYDTVWDVNTKLFVVNFIACGKRYIVARFQKNFIVFEEGKLILLTNNVSRDLAEAYEKIFSFSIYLPNKSTKKTELASPVFSFMPYYIDQDRGWNGLYNSFLKLDQYKKDDREKSLYFHLNIYDKHRVERLAEKDRLQGEIDVLKEKEEKLKITIDSLSQEVQHLIPADTITELETNLKIPKEKISILVAQIGEVRNKVQELETILQQHEYQLNIVKEYHKIKQNSNFQRNVALQECPRCGYVFEDELYDMVRSNYNVNNEDYMCQQIQLIINSITEELNTYKEKYVSLMDELGKTEKVFDGSQDSYDVYVKQRGLEKSMRNFTSQLNRNMEEQLKRNEEIKKIKKELRKLPNKKEVESKYVELVRFNIMKLGAWDSSYEGNIKLTKPIKAQGTLESKIILAQYVGLFQTMEYFKSKAIRFPFIVDSPRAKEASYISSKEIIKMIFEINSLPQIILATVDFQDYENDVKCKFCKTVLTEQKRLLNTETYDKYRKTIEDFIELLKSL
ncbi:hypothetical protein [[Clostridium] scindens]|uniref:hypothetical protein n=1 Tax=Clostridium scindens (strain JCM 10418 / VPI 12708) TaxID=29347 RepID=UPI0039A1BE09